MVVSAARPRAALQRPGDWGPLRIHNTPTFAVLRRAGMEPYSTRASRHRITTPCTCTTTTWTVSMAAELRCARAAGRLVRRLRFRDTQRRRTERIPFFVRPRHRAQVCVSGADRDLLAYADEFCRQALSWMCEDRATVRADNRLKSSTIYMATAARHADVHPSPGKRRCAMTIAIPVELAASLPVDLHFLNSAAPTASAWICSGSRSRCRGNPGAPCYSGCSRAAILSMVAANDGRLDQFLDGGGNLAYQGGNGSTGWWP